MVCSSAKGGRGDAGRPVDVSGCGDDDATLKFLSSNEAAEKVDDPETWEDCFLAMSAAVWEVPFLGFDAYPRAFSNHRDQQLVTILRVAITRNVGDGLV